MTDICIASKKPSKISTQNPFLSRSFHASCNQVSSALMIFLLSRKPGSTLKDKRKMIVRQAVVHLSHAVWVAREEQDVEKGWKTQARWALLQQVASQYQSASAPQKKQIVTHFVASTGSHAVSPFWRQTRVVRCGG
jgi:hypothetical protein